MEPFQNWSGYQQQEGDLRSQEKSMGLFSFPWDRREVDWEGTKLSYPYSHCISAPSRNESSFKAALI